MAGGLVYGYRNVRGDGHVSREVVPAEAEILRRIFRNVTQGFGFIKIATQLNAEGVPAPRGGAAWSCSTVRSMLFRDLYRGRPVWGQTRWADVGGTKRKVRVEDAASWTVRHLPEQQIIEDALWQAAHARLAESRAVYVSKPNAKGRPTNPTGGRYLLTGLLRCQHCGGGLYACRQTHGSGCWTYYVCANQRTRGIRCPGALRVPMEKLDAVILEELGTHVLTPATITKAVSLAVRRLTAEAPASGSRRTGLQRELRSVEQKLGRYAEALPQPAPCHRSWRPSRLVNDAARHSWATWVSWTHSNRRQP